MDFDQAVVAHGAWKKKLANYLAKRDQSLNADEAALDNKCPLGQWIYGEGSKSPNRPTIQSSRVSTLGSIKQSAL